MLEAGISRARAERTGALVIAAIPIAFTLVAVDSSLRVFHNYFDVTVETDNNQAEEQAATAAAAALPMST